MSLQRISTIVFWSDVLADETPCAEPACYCQAGALVANPAGLVWPVCQDAADYATWSTSGKLDLPEQTAASWAVVLAAYQQSHNFVGAAL